MYTKSILNFTLVSLISLSEDIDKVRDETVYYISFEKIGPSILFESNHIDYVNDNNRLEFVVTSKIN